MFIQPDQENRYFYQSRVRLLWFGVDVLYISLAYRMRKVLFAVFVVYVWMNAVARVPDEAAIYSAILARALQRKRLAPAAAVEDKKVSRRKFSAQQAQLLRDVTLSFRPSMSSAEKYTFFERLM